MCIRDSLILTLWKRDDEAPKRSEEVALSNAVSAYIERIGNDRSVTDVYKRQVDDWGFLLLSASRLIASSRLPSSFSARANSSIFSLSSVVYV